jgi:hypothetical protein
MSLEVANTILQQLGGKKFVVMTGASNFVGSSDALSFKIGKNANKVTHVRITLTPADLYNVTYLNVRGTTVKTVTTDEGIYADMLRECFTRSTGLHTTLN